MSLKPISERSYMVDITHLDGVTVTNLKQNKPIALREWRPLPRHVIKSKSKNPDIFFVFSDPDQPQNLMGSKLLY